MARAPCFCGGQGSWDRWWEAADRFQRYQPEPKLNRAPRLELVLFTSKRIPLEATRVPGKTAWRKERSALWC